MSLKDNNTEKLIRDTAMRIFFKEGHFNATTQEIADAAGVNRTLVHYYFRSRDLLFKQVLEEGKIEFQNRVNEMLRPEHSFKEKMSNLIDIWMERGLNYPFLDVYLVSQLNDPAALEAIVQIQQGDEEKIDIFFKEIEEEMEAGNLVKMEPIQFLINLVSMVSHPIMMRPLLQRAFAAKNVNFDDVIANRKDAILKTIFRN